MIYELSKMSTLDRHGISLSCSNTYLHYHQSQYYQHITDSLISQSDGKWELAILWFVSNFARAMNSTAEGMRVSLDPGYYSGNKAKIGYRGVKALLELLEAKSYIHIYKGYVDTWKFDNGARTPEYVISSCVVFRKRLLDLWDSDKMFNLFEETSLSDSVEVRSRATGDALGTRGKIGIKEAREKMDTYNTSLKSADIKYNGKQIATVEYKRVYLDTMHVAGRIYAAGGGVQLLPQKLRNDYLEIDGEPVVELDYNAIHPSICYQMLLKDGINVLDLMGEDFNPYGADLSFVEVDQDLVDEQSQIVGKKYNPLRNLAKLAILIGINSVDEAQAVGAMSGKVRDDFKKKDQADKLFVGVVGTIPVKRILSAIRQHNDLIKDSFYKDKGVLLQKVDSEIMMNIIEAMVQKDHTVLAYHDSCLVKASAESDLREAMFSAWKNVLGDTTFCKVDNK
jgi:hypothetical protein